MSASGGGIVTYSDPRPQSNDSDYAVQQKILWALLGGMTPGSATAAGAFGEAPAGTVEQVIDYYTTTNNIETIVFKDSGGATLKTLTYTYLASGVADNDKLTGIVQS